MHSTVVFKNALFETDIRLALLATKVCYYG